MYNVLFLTNVNQVYKDREPVAWLVFWYFLFCLFFTYLPFHDEHGNDIIL